MSCPHGPVNNGQVWIWGEKAKVLNDLQGQRALRKSVNEWHELQKWPGLLQEKGH